MPSRRRFVNARRRLNVNAKEYPRTRRRTPTPRPTSPTPRPTSPPRWTPPPRLRSRLWRLRSRTRFEPRRRTARIWRSLATSTPRFTRARSWTPKNSTPSSRNSPPASPTRRRTPPPRERAPNQIRSRRMTTRRRTIRPSRLWRLSWRRFARRRRGSSRRWRTSRRTRR